MGSSALAQTPNDLFIEFPDTQICHIIC
jgi:hypothetical protein